MARLLGGTNQITNQGFQLGNPGNPKSLEAINLLRSQSQDQRVIRFKELVKAGKTPNQAKKIVIEEFKLNRNPKAGTPVWMTRGRNELIAEGFDYKASARGPENVGGVEKAATKRKNVIGEGRKFEERIKRTKQKTGLGKAYEMAHTANIFQAKKLGIDYPIDALAIQTQDVNNKVAEALNDELKPLYRKQLKLVNKLKRKSTEGLKNQLDKINNKLLETVATGGKQGDVAANVLKPIIVNRDTLKGYIYTGAFDSFAELQASPGATTKATAAGSVDDVMARANVELFFSNIRKNALANGPICSLVRARGATGGTLTCVDAVNDALEKDPKRLAQDINKSNQGGAFNKIKNSSTKFLTALKDNPNLLKGSLGSKIALGLGTVAAGVGAGALVKQFRNDDPSTYLTNDSQMEGMIISDVEQKGKEVDDNILLDNQFKLEAAAAAGLTTPIAGQVYRTAREGTPPLLESPLEFDNEIKTLKRTIRQITHPGGKKAKRISEAGQEVIRNSKIRISQLQNAVETAKVGKEGSGVFRSAFGLEKGVLGKGLWALGAPIVQVPSTLGYIAQDVREGKDVGEIATNPLNYLGAAFMNPAVKALGKAGMSRGLLGIASLGLAGTAALPAISIGAGLATLGTLGYQGYKLFTGKNKSDEDFFR